jgi:hypothetical protein
MRRTINIDDRILKQIEAIRKNEGRSMGVVISEWLADALARRRATRSRAAFRWTSRLMKSLVDLTDKEAVYAAPNVDGS